MIPSSRPQAASWLVPAGLVALGLVPFVAGLVRLGGLAAGQPVTPENERFVTMPWPVVLHIVGASLFSLVGAFQFSASVRRTHPGWHRVAGRVLFVAGMTTALSGLWMTEFYPLRPNLEGPLLYGTRLVLGTAMAVFLVLGLRAVLGRNLGSHRAWMTRAYAIAMGAGTQVLTTLPWVAIFGPPDGTTRDLLMLAGWAINLAVAEAFLYRARAPRKNRSN